MLLRDVKRSGLTKESQILYSIYDCVHNCNPPKNNIYDESLSSHHMTISFVPAYKILHYNIECMSQFGFSVSDYT